MSFVLKAFDRVARNDCSVSLAREDPINIHHASRLLDVARSSGASQADRLDRAKQFDLLDNRFGPAAAPDASTS
jgi:hypothetical protein